MYRLDERRLGRKIGEASGNPLSDKAYRQRYDEETGQVGFVHEDMCPSEGKQERTFRISHFLLSKGMISEGNNKSSCMRIRDYVLFHRMFLRDFQAWVEIQVRDCTRVSKCR